MGSDTEQKILEVVLELNDKFSGGLANTNRQIGGLAGNLQKTGRAMKAVGTSMSRYVTVPILAAGGAIIKLGLDFDKSMRRVKALSGATGEQFEQLRQQAKDLGATTVFTANQAAEAQGFLAMAGFKTNEILGAMPGTLAMAAAGQVDLARAADIASNILTGFNLEVKDMGRVSDVLTNTFTSANVDLEMLGETMKYIAPVAAGAGMQFEEIAAAVGLMGNAGIQASQAGTSLRMGILSLIDPGDKAAAIMKELKLQVMDSEGAMLPLVDIIRQLEIGLGEMGEAQQMATLKTLVGQRAASGFAGLISQGSEALNELTQSNLNAAGKAQEIAEEMMTPWERFKSAVQGAGLAISESGLLDDFTRIITKLTDYLRKIAQASPATLRFATGLATVAAIAGPALMVIGQMSIGIAALSRGMVGFTAGINAFLAGPGWGFNVWLAKATGTAAGGAGALGLLAALTALAATVWTINIKYAIENWDPSARAAEDFQRMLRERVGPEGETAWDMATDFQKGEAALEYAMQDAAPRLKTNFASLWEGLKLVYDQSWFHTTADKDIQAALDAIAQLFSSGTGPIAAEWDAFWQGCKEIYDTSWFHTVADVWIQEKLDAIAAFFTNAKTTIPQLWNDMWTALRDTATSWGQQIVDKVTWFKEKVQGVFTWLKDVVVGHSIWPDMWGKMLNVTVAYAADIESEVSTMSGNILDEIRTLEDTSVASFEHMGWAMADAFQRAGQQVAATLAGIAQQVAGVATTLRQQLSDAIAGAVEAANQAMIAGGTGWETAAAGLDTEEGILRGDNGEILMQGGQYTMAGLEALKAAGVDISEMLSMINTYEPQYQNPLATYSRSGLENLGLLGGCGPGG